MDKETIIIIAVIALVLLAVLYTTGIVSINTGKSGTGRSSENIPEECKVPTGQDVDSWKEHLGHHESTKYCLDYYK